MKKEFKEMLPLKERFLRHVIPVRDSGCWYWSGAKNNGGYGQMTVKRKLNMAHRISYNIYKGPITKGLFVCHKCDTPSCVNPEHLFLGTPKENSQDALNKKRCRGYFQGHESPVSILNKNQVLEIIRSDLPQNELAKIYGVSNQTINSIVMGKTYKNVSGLKFEKSKQRKGSQGDKNHKSKLTSENVLCILKSKKRKVDLQKDYGVSKSTILNIFNGRAWSKLTGKTYQRTRGENVQP